MLDKATIRAAAGVATRDKAAPAAANADEVDTDDKSVVFGSGHIRNDEDRRDDENDTAIGGRCFCQLNTADAELG